MNTYYINIYHDKTGRLTASEDGNLSLSCEDALNEAIHYETEYGWEYIDTLTNADRVNLRHSINAEKREQAKEEAYPYETQVRNEYMAGVAL